MKLYLGKPFLPPTYLVFNGRQNEQDVTGVWGFSIGMFFIGIIRCANTRGPVTMIRDRVHPGIDSF